MFILFCRSAVDVLITFRVFSLRDGPKCRALVASLEVADSHQMLCKCTKILRKLRCDIQQFLEHHGFCKSSFIRCYMIAIKFRNTLSHKIPPNFFFFPRRIHQHYLTSLRPQVVSGYIQFPPTPHSPLPMLHYVSSLFNHLSILCAQILLEVKVTHYTCTVRIGWSLYIQ